MANFKPNIDFSANDADMQDLLGGSLVKPAQITEQSAPEQKESAPAEQPAEEEKSELEVAPKAETAPKTKAEKPARKAKAEARKNIEVDDEVLARREHFKELIYNRPVEFSTSNKTMAVTIPEEIGRNLKILSGATGMNMRVLLTNLAKEFLETYSEEIESVKRKAQQANDIFD